MIRISKSICTISIIGILSCVACSQVDRGNAEAQLSPMQGLKNNILQQSISEIEVLARGQGSLTTIMMTPERFDDNVAHRKCVILFSSEIADSLLKAITNAKYHAHEKDEDTFWHLKFIARTGNVINNVFVGLKYNNYRNVFLKIDGKISEDEGQLNDWLLGHLDMNKCVYTPELIK